MSTLNTIRVQLGQSGTPANNFTLDASAANGSMKLARGNALATIQDILGVDAAGVLDALVGLKKGGSIVQALSDFIGSNQSLAANGFQKFPGGLILQWGYVVATSGGQSVTYPIAFPTKIVALTFGAQAGASASIWSNAEVSNNNKTGFTLYSSSASAQSSFISAGY